MSKLEIGLYDILDESAMATSPVAADVYEQHIRIAQVHIWLGFVGMLSPHMCTCASTISIAFSLSA